MTHVTNNNAVQFKVNNDESFNCRFKLPKELVSIFQKLDDKRLVKTEVKTYGKCGGMRFDLTFVNKKNKKFGTSGFTCCNLLSFLKSTDKLREKIACLEFKVYQLCKRLEELQCIECSGQSRQYDPSRVGNFYAIDMVRGNGENGIAQNGNCDPNGRKRRHMP